MLQAGADTSLEDNEGRTAGSFIKRSCFSFVNYKGVVAETYKHLPVADCINSPR